jgi:hypothetical protein
MMQRSAACAFSPLNLFRDGMTAVPSASSSATGGTTTAAQELLQAATGIRTRASTATRCYTRECQVNSSRYLEST